MLVLWIWVQPDL